MSDIHVKGAWGAAALELFHHALAPVAALPVSDAFLIVAPGITIRDRLRVLLPNDPQNYYAQRDIVPPHMREDLERAKIIITNFHAFRLREKVSAGKLTKAILEQNGESAFTETPPEMVHRVFRELGGKKNIIVLNDEAHHCYDRHLGRVEFNPKPYR